MQQAPRQVHDERPISSVNAGVPADKATMHTRTRRPSRPADTIHVKVGAGRLEEYHRLADLSETTVGAVALEAITQAFDAIRTRLGNPI